MTTILISGGDGNLAKEIVKANNGYNIIALPKSSLNISLLHLKSKLVKLLISSFFFVFGILALLFLRKFNKLIGLFMIIYSYIKPVP